MRLFISKALVIGHTNRQIKADRMRRFLQLSVEWDSSQPEKFRYREIVKAIKIEQYWDENIVSKLLCEQFPRIRKEKVFKHTRIVTLVPGSSRSQSWKRWPVSSWRGLITLLMEGNITCHILGGIDDVAFVEEIVEGISNEKR